MKIKSKIWKFGENYKVHIRKELLKRMSNLLEDEPSTYYYKNNKLIEVDFNVPASKKNSVKRFIIENKLKSI